MIEELNKGEFGTVYLCQDKISSKQFALKAPIKSNVNIYRDISIKSLIDDYYHTPYDYGLYYYESKICMAMEFMSKGSLKFYIENIKFLPINEVAKISYQILKQLDRIHHLDIIHRDIKSDNIVLDWFLNAKLIDFGLSKYTYNLSNEELQERLNIYAPGTVGYMALELLNNESYTNKIDIWSFGIVIIEMVTGHVPYAKLSMADAIKIITSERSIRYKLPKSSPIELHDFINYCLKPIPKERMSAQDLLKSKFIQKFNVKR